MVSWLRSTALADGYIGEDDLSSLLVTDDLSEVAAVFGAVEHRRPRAHQHAA
jgi:hypothetical protein